MITLMGTRFGDMEVDDSRAMTFARGLVGFPEARRYVLLEPRGSSHIAWLQSLEVPVLAFPVMDGATMGPGYPKPTATELARRAGLGAERLALLVVVARTHPDGPLVANLLAPLLIDLETREGVQVVLDHRVFSAAAPLAPRPTENAAQ